MSASGYTLLVALHGLGAALTWALLLHPIVFLRGRRPARRPAQLTAVGAAVAMTAVFAVGSWAYPTYRGRVKPALVFGDDPAWRWFESKEHLAVLAVCAAWAGAVWVVAMPARPGGGRALLVAAWALLTTVMALGLVVHAAVHPGWG
jgi:hypothetical protein